jgi:hypothetical protein
MNDDNESLMMMVLMNGFNDDHLEAEGLTVRYGVIRQSDAGVLER